MLKHVEIDTVVLSPSAINCVLAFMLVMFEFMMT
jgi:hypothetical protein